MPNNFTKININGTEYLPNLDRSSDSYQQMSLGRFSEAGLFDPDRDFYIYIAKLRQSGDDGNGGSLIIDGYLGNFVPPMYVHLSISTRNALNIKGWRDNGDISNSDLRLYIDESGFYYVYLYVPKNSWQCCDLKVTHGGNYLGQFMCIVDVAEKITERLFELPSNLNLAWSLKEHLTDIGYVTHFVEDTTLYM